MAEDKTVAQWERDEDRESLLARLREEHGAITPFELPGGRIVVMAGTTNRLEYGRYVKALVKQDGDMINGAHAFALVCVAYPSRDELRAWLAKHPGDTLDLAAAGAELSGSGLKRLEGN